VRSLDDLRLHATDQDTPLLLGVKRDGKTLYLMLTPNGNGPP
jgi:hypothetical protein